MYRTELLAALVRLKKADLPGGISLDFAEEVKEVRQMSEKVEAPKREVGRGDGPAIPPTEANARMIALGLRPSPSGLNMDYYRALARQDPNVALAGLRMEFDIIARNLAKGFGVGDIESKTGATLLDHLQEHGAITSSQADLARKVMRLCDAAVHGTPVTREQANAVVDSAEILARQYLDWLGWGFPGGWKPSSVPKQGN